ncbi:MAG: Flagellar protein FlaG [Lachnoclostridium sp.]
MAIDSITNTIALTDYNRGQKEQSVHQVVKTSEADSVSKANADKKVKDDEKKQIQADLNYIKNILNETNRKIKPTKTRCEFSYHEDINRVSIKILDAESNEVIREIPPEETLEMIQKLWEVAGLLVDEKR